MEFDNILSNSPLDQEEAEQEDAEQKEPEQKEAEQVQLQERSNFLRDLRQNKRRIRRIETAL